MDKEAETQAKKMFELYDANKNGFIEFREFKKLVKDASEKTGIYIPEDAVINAFEDSDANDDRLISLDEFLKVFNQLATDKYI